MKRLSLYTALLSTSFLLQADPKADLQAAAKKLSDAPNYSWVSKTAIEGGQYTPAPILGKAEKGGFALLTTECDGNVTTAVQHGANAIVMFGLDFFRQQIGRKLHHWGNQRRRLDIGLERFLQTWQDRKFGAK